MYFRKYQIPFRLTSPGPARLFAISAAPHPFVDLKTIEVHGCVSSMERNVAALLKTTNGRLSAVDVSRTR
jgi:hypothetical protein